jgi:hypothetical protein
MKLTPKQKLLLSKMGKAKSKEDLATAASLTVPQVISLLGKLKALGYVLKNLKDLWERTTTGKEAMKTK